MKILILSYSTGEGHNSAAKAILEATKDNGIESELVDFSYFMSKKGEKKSTKKTFYNSLVEKNPKLFGPIYSVGEWFSSTKITSPVYLINSLYVKKLAEYIEYNNFTAVICTHLFAMEAMTALRKKLLINVPCYAVATDYTCQPFMVETKLDGYFIPHKDLVDEFVKKGVPKEKLIVTGIPVSKKFAEHIEKSVARNYLVIPQDKTMYLIMSGGVGCENILALCNEINNNGGDNFVAYVLAGRNSELHDKIVEKYGIDSKIRAITFTTKVNLYMQSADVVISKPGGLSSTEAGVSNVALVHTCEIPGCESINANFFSSRGLSIFASKPKDAVREAKLLAESPARINEIKQKQSEQIIADSADRIVKEVVKNGR